MKEKKFHGQLADMLAQFKHTALLRSELAEVLCKNFSVQPLPKGDKMMVENGNSLNLLFEGLLCSAISDGHHQSVNFISTPGDFIPRAGSRLEETRVALKDSLIIKWDRAVLSNIGDQYPELYQFLYQLEAAHYTKKCEIDFYSRLGSPAQRYNYLRQHFSAHFEQLPEDVLADYLKIKKSTLKKLYLQAEQLSPKKASLSKADIENYLTLRHPYLQKRLTIAQFAAQLSLTPHELSRLVNVYFKKNFNQLINEYRVRHIIKQMEQRHFTLQYSIDGMGQLAGFMSRSVFFNEFKRFTQLTPKKYLAQLRHGC